jgi:hypothetical protein
MEQADIGEVEIQGTYDQYQDFTNSVVWNDIRKEIETWMEIIKNTLGSSDVPMELYRMQGRLQALESVLSLPVDMMSLLEDRYKAPDDTEINEYLDTHTSQEIMDSIL